MQSNIEHLLSQIAEQQKQIRGLLVREKQEEIQEEQKEEYEDKFAEINEQLLTQVCKKCRSQPATIAITNNGDVRLEAQDFQFCFDCIYKKEKLSCANSVSNYCPNCKQIYAHRECTIEPATTQAHKQLVAKLKPLCASAKCRPQFLHIVPNNVTLCQSYPRYMCIRCTGPNSYYPACRLCTKCQECLGYHKMAQDKAILAVIDANNKANKERLPSTCIFCKAQFRPKPAQMFSQQATHMLIFELVKNSCGVCEAIYFG